MKKFAVFSGFLGSGKTTAMMALTRYYTKTHGKAAMISNDLGGPGLADDRLARLSGCDASELTGTCICYQTENLVARLEEKYREGCDLVVSDIPGFGIGALNHVYHTLHEKYPELCSLSPFTVLCEPESLKILVEKQDEDLCYILKNQLLEADLIVLSKSDLLSASEKEKCLQTLGKINPQAQILAISALTGEGLEDLALALTEKAASLRNPDLGYGNMQFRAAMGRISEYNLQYYAVVCCETFDGTAYLQDMAREISQQLRIGSDRIPHMKLLAWEPEGDYGKVDLLGADRPVVVTKPFPKPCTELAVVLNASAFCESQKLDQLITAAMEKISDRYQLTVTVFKKECFAALEGS